MTERDSKCTSLLDIKSIRQVQWGVKGYVCIFGWVSWKTWKDHERPDCGYPANVSGSFSVGRQCLRQFAHIGTYQQLQIVAKARRAAHFEGSHLSNGDI